MNVPSNSAPTPIQTPVTGEPKTPSVKNDGSTDPSAPQPTVLAALPPGQGTRIDQIA